VHGRPRIARGSLSGPQRTQQTRPLLGVAGEFRRNREVDETRWLRIDRAAEMLTYEHDLVVVAGLQLVGTAM
jgi:hypothetical protein